MLKYTGHPIFDVGLATLCAFSRKSLPEELTGRDFDAVARYIEDYYIVNPLKAFLTSVFMNSGYVQGAFDEARRLNYARRMARGYEADTPTTGERCVFTGLPAVGVALSPSEKEEADDAIKGRAFRHNVPMLTGEGIINFHPGGDAGLPVSGVALLCIQAFPLGCAKCGGKLLAVHSDNPDIMLKFAEAFLADNRRKINLAREADESKLPDADMPAKTLLVNTLLEIEKARKAEKEQDKPYSVTVYHLTNSGQSSPLDARNPPLEIYYLPLELTSFLRAVTTVGYRDEWERLAKRAWQLTHEEMRTQKGEKPRRGRARKETESASKPKKARTRRNFLYEDVFRLPENARQFIRRYFLRIPIRNAFEDDPRRAYSLRSEADLVSWKLTQLFLERILHMKQGRIDRIRELGDQLADYIASENDRRFFSAFYAESRYDLLRSAMIRVNQHRLKRNLPPIIRLEPYVEIFEDENGRSDWRLARDLVLIRMIERLYEIKWIERHQDAIPDQPDETVTESNNAN